MSERKISALIVDDEALGRRLVRRMLSTHPDIHVMAECNDGEKALAAITRHRPALVFLDIQMPKLDGLTVLQRLEPGLRPLVVFITAYDAYAIKAFEAQALDYLLKPFDQERFDRTLANIRRRLTQMDEASLGQNLRKLLIAHGPRPDQAHGAAAPLALGQTFDERIAVKETGRVFFVDVADIDWLEASANYVALHVAGRTHLIHETMAVMETRMNPSRFVRIHRSTIVNVTRIKELLPHFNGEYVVLLKDGTRLKLSRGQLGKAKAALGLD
jgi:two-component system, LytTR family, response regulator